MMFQILVSFPRRTELWNKILTANLSQSLYGAGWGNFANYEKRSRRLMSKELKKGWSVTSNPSQIVPFIESVMCPSQFPVTAALEMMVSVSLFRHHVPPLM